MLRVTLNGDVHGFPNITRQHVQPQSKTQYLTRNMVGLSISRQIDWLEQHIRSVNIHSMYYRCADHLSV